MVHIRIIYSNMDKYTIPNLTNACRVLRTLAKEKQGMSVSQISKKLSIPRTTALRIMSTLASEGLLLNENKHYCLGNGLIHLGMQALSFVDIRTIAIPIMKELTEKTRETCHLAVLSNDKVLLIEVCDSPHPVRVASRPGTLALLHCSATGKIFIAYVIGDKINEFFKGKEIEKRTNNTMISIKEIEVEAHTTLNQGYAVDNEEYHEGVRCLAAPIFNAHKNVIAAVGITASTVTFTIERIPDMAHHVREAAQAISKNLGA